VSASYPSAFAAYVSTYPWQWTPAMVDEWVGGTALLRLGEPASPIPAAVASLLQQYIAGRANMTTATNPASRWLFPGRRACQPCRPDHLSALLGKVGVPASAARGAAIRQQLLEMPAPVVADALGYHDKTTTPSPQRSRQSMEPIRRWRSRKVTTTPGSTRNSRQLLTSPPGFCREGRSYPGRSPLPPASCAPGREGAGASKGQPDPGHSRSARPRSAMPGCPGDPRREGAPRQR
jgi:hypothetical protein